MNHDPTAPATAAATPEELTARLFAWRRGFNALHLVDLGLQLGLFESLAREPGCTSDALARRLGLHAPYVRVWCTTAYSLALLEADEGEALRLAPHVDALLADARHPRYLGGYVQLGTRFATDDYRAAADGLRSGTRVPFQGRSESFAEVIAQALAGVNLMVARKVLPSIAPLAEVLNRGGTLLEVGCGTGRLQLQLARAFPAANCVGIDIDPTGVAAARRAVEEAGLAQRIRIVEGDVANAIAPASADLVLMVEVLHEIDAAIRPPLLAACARALKPGGWLVIVDETYPGHLEEARAPAFRFPLQTGLEEMMWGNIVPTRTEQERLLRGAGFAGSIERSVFGEGFTLLVTRL
jgi:SAM-dependent methyltransferase